MHSNINYIIGPSCQPSASPETPLAAPACSLADCVLSTATDPRKPLQECVEPSSLAPCLLVMGSRSDLVHLLVFGRQLRTGVHGPRRERKP